MLFQARHPLYLDNNASTPVDKEVLGEMLPWFSERFGNASSHSHLYGWEAAEAIKIAREKTAALIAAETDEIIFTSGATESINLAIQGVFNNYQSKGKHIVLYATEHKAVLDTCTALEKQGAEITILEVDSNGLPDLELAEKSLREDTILFCAMWANNETGVIFPIKELSEIIRKKKVLFFTDATQAAGKIPVRVEGIDLLCLSAHKIYGPKGVGALYVRKKNPRVGLKELVHGGGHEKGLRSGTLNVPGIVGLGKAAEMAQQGLAIEGKRIMLLREELETSLVKKNLARINGGQSLRLPNTCNLEIPGVKADSLISKIPELAFSTGSACSSALAAPSHVLSAMGLNEGQAYSSIRLSLGRFTKKEDVDFAIIALEKGINAVRGETKV